MFTNKVVDMWGVLVLGGVIAIIIVLNEIFQSYTRTDARRQLYKLAYDRSITLGRPLIVIGDPHNGLGALLHGPAYGSGSFTIDISGCSKNICADVIERDIIVSLRAFEDNSCVIFVSCVLEYIKDADIETAISEIQRVAGSSNNIFVVTVGSTSLSSYYYSYDNNGKHLDVAARIFKSAPPNGPFKYTNFSSRDGSNSDRDGRDP